MADLISLKKEMEGYGNTLVLDDFNVVMLLNVEEHKEDFYWVLEKFDDTIYYKSCCGGWLPLLDYLPEDKYTELKNIWEMNKEARRPKISEE